MSKKLFFIIIAFTFLLTFSYVILDASCSYQCHASAGGGCMEEMERECLLSYNGELISIWLERSWCQGTTCVSMYNVWCDLGVEIEHCFDWYCLESESFDCGGW